jgi:hypothetical protein
VRVALLLLFSACSFQHGLPVVPDDGPVGGSDGGTDSNGSGSDAAIDAPPSPLRQKTITITANVNGNHANFPVWISLTDADLAARARADGTDIHFVEGTTDLDFEIQSWNKATGRLDAWVRVPTLTANDEIVIRYGDLAAAHAANAPGTFTGYQAVWHLDDALTNTTVADARNLRNGTAVSLTTTDSVAAQLGRGIDFEDGTQAITFTNPLTGNTAHTISAWVNQRATTTNDAIIAMGNSVLNQARWFHSRYNAASIAVGFYTNDYDNVNEDIIAGGWVLLHWVYEAGANRRTRLYRDGVEVGMNTHNPGINTQGTAGTIGNAGALFGVDMGLNATLDEVRIIDAARNANWIAAEALNQTTPASFYTVSAEQQP